MINQQVQSHQYRITGSSMFSETVARSGDTALIRAARYNRVKIIKFLLKAGADAALENDYSENAMKAASRADHTQSINLLKKYAEKKEPRSKKA